MLSPLGCPPLGAAPHWVPPPMRRSSSMAPDNEKGSGVSRRWFCLNFPFCPQVAMGYAHSLVIARDESDAEKEKLRKLPEYNPRTL